MHTASALHTAALLDEVERLATRDSLTGIANRRLFDESLGREAARAQRLRTSLSLIVFDIDHFKQINDAYGHLTGDAVLRSVADAIVASTKSFDLAARYGGDEFVLLLPGCDHDHAIARGRARAGRDRAPGARRAGHRECGARHDARERHRRRPAALRRRRRALRGEAQRPRPCRRVRPRRGAASPVVVRLDEAQLARGA